jgi:hypothetical protein
MATITVPTDKLVISLDGFATNNFGSASGNLNGSNAGVAMIFVPYENFTLTQIVFFYTVTTSPSPNTFDVGIQGLNATTGMPDGTFVTSGTWTAPASGSGFATVTVTSFSMVKGTQYFIVIRNATAGYTGGVAITANASNNTFQRVVGAYSRTSGVWAQPTTRPAGNIFLYSGSKYYGTCCYTTSGSETARSSPNEIGTTFQLPANHPTLTLRSMQFNVAGTIAAGTAFEVRVRNAAGTLLATATVDGDFNSTSTLPFFEFNNAVDFVAGTKYYIMLTGTTGTPPLMRTCTQPNAQVPTDIRNGIIANMVEYDGTTFTETTTKICQGYLIFDSIKYDQTGGTTNYIIPSGFETFFNG